MFASVVVVLWVGAQDVLAGRMSAGRLSQFVLYAVFAAAGLGQLSEVWGEISQASGAAERLFEILRVRPVIVAAGAASRAAGTAARRDRLRGCPLSPIRRGRRASCSTAYRFECGAVKRSRSSVLRAPARARSFISSCGSTIPTSGVITFDGVPLVDVDPLALRRRIALVPQDTAIFAASIGENIRFGRPDASDAEVQRAAELAHAVEFIARLPQSSTPRSASAA